MVLTDQSAKPMSDITMQPKIRQRITDAATRVLIRDGLDRWTVEAVASEAGCAKGLVHYHHGTKAKLLAEVAGQLSRHRMDQRRSALTHSGASGLDALWEVLEGNASSGRTAAWLSLLGYLGGAAAGLGPNDDELAEFADRAALALALPMLPPAQGRALHAALDGFEIALATQSDREAVHEAYHTLWLLMIPV
jgi:AcrR family transcriptional regulator